MNTFFNHHSEELPITFQIKRDTAAQTISVRAFARQGTVVGGVKDGEFVFDPRALREHPDHGRFWRDHMCWVIEHRGEPLRPDYCRALYPFTFTSGAPDPDMRPTVPRYVSIFVPFADSSVEDMLVMCYIERGLPLIESPAEMADRRILEKTRMPGLELILPPRCRPDEAVEGTVKLRSPNGIIPEKTAVVLESSAGSLSKREFNLIRGEARFRLEARGLEAGDECVVRAGFPYYRNKAEARVSVEV